MPGDRGAASPGGQGRPSLPGGQGRPSSPGGQDGFTLLEVLVAFVIAALAIGILFEGAVTGLRSARSAGHTEEAIARARSRLAAIGLDGRLVAGEQSGDDGGGFSWRSRVTPLASSALGGDAGAGGGGGQPAGAAAGPQSPRAVLYAVSVSVSWSLDGGNRQVVLQTERLGASLPPPP